MQIAWMLALVGFLVPSACGGMVDSENRGTAMMDADFEAQDAAPDAPPDSAIEYAGQLSARLRSYKGNLSYALDVSFWEGAPLLPRAPSCGNDGITVGNCCAGLIKLALPVGPLVPLVAGDVTIDLHGTPLATLLAPDYAEIDDAVWNGGDVLGVSAPGGNIAAFSGNLETPALIAGVTPPFGSTPVMIAKGADVPISWTPEGRDGETMQLQIDAVATAGPADVILCTVPDSAGSVVVDASLLARIPSAVSGSIHLTRSITSNVSGANVRVTLVGEAWLDALADVP